MVENPPREPLAHIARPALPWRSAATKAECGRDLNDCAEVATLEEAQAIWKRHGAQRAVFMLCSTCVSTANRHSLWNDDNGVDWAHLLQREIGFHDNADLNRELLALGMMVRSHPEEWAALLKGLREATPLAERRARRGRR